MPRVIQSYGCYFRLTTPCSSSGGSGPRWTSWARWARRWTRAGTASTRRRRTPRRARAWSPPAAARTKWSWGWGTRSVSADPSQTRPPASGSSSSQHSAFFMSYPYPSQVAKSVKIVETLGSLQVIREKFLVAGLWLVKLLILANHRSATENFFQITLSDPSV